MKDGQDSFSEADRLGWLYFAYFQEDHHNISRIAGLCSALDGLAMTSLKFRQGFLGKGIQVALGNILLYLSIPVFKI